MNEAFSEALESSGVIAIFRAVPGPEMAGLAKALVGAGIVLMEVAMSEPEASGKLERLSAEVGSVAVLGAGTVTSRALAKEAVAAGARFLVTPHVVPSVNAFGREHGVLVLGGALTPTEIAVAREQGNDFVKVFPAGPLGPAYFRALRGPYPDARLVAVGGINADNAGAFVRAGAAGVAVGGALTGHAARAGGRVADAAHQLLESVRVARRESA